MHTLQKQPDGSLGFTEVKGHKIEIEGFEDFNFFYYKERLERFHIIEQRSGLSLASGYRLKDAKWTAKDRLDRHGRDFFMRAIKGAVEKNGMPPGIE